MIWTLDPDGMAQIYNTKPGGTEFYLNIADPYTGGAYSSRPRSSRIYYDKL
jgi:hypothetical protein